MSDNTRILSTFPNKYVLTPQGRLTLTNGTPIMTSDTAITSGTASVTVTSASPAVITWTANGLANGTPVYFTAATMPTGMNAYTTYYVINVTANSFNISATPGGQAINTTSTGTTVVGNYSYPATSVIYYTPYTGTTVPIYNGTSFLLFPFSQLFLVLDSNQAHVGYQGSGFLYDLFVFLNNGILTLATGPAWANTAVRSNAINQINGIWLNAGTIELKIDASSTLVSVGANQATYVGTMYATNNGVTGMQFKPSSAAGGSNPILGLWNAYNRAAVVSQNKDSTASWSYSAAVWRPSDGSNNNRISYVDGLGKSFVRASFSDFVGLGVSIAVILGINFNSTTATPVNAQVLGTSSGPIPVIDSFYPTMGFNYVQAMEYAGGSATLFGVNTFSVHELRIDLEM